MEIPTIYNGIWTEYPELHNQGSLNPKHVYVLESQVGEFVVKTIPPPTITNDVRALARQFSGSYLLRTCWEWEREYKAIQA